MQITTTETTGYVRPDGVYDIRRIEKVVETTDHAPITACNDGDLVAIFNGDYWSVAQVSSAHATCAILDGIAWPLDKLYQPLADELQAYAEAQSDNKAGIALAQAMIATLDTCERQAEADDTSSAAPAPLAHATIAKEKRSMPYAIQTAITWEEPQSIHGGQHTLPTGEVVYDMCPLHYDRQGERLWEISGEIIYNPYRRDYRAMVICRTHLTRPRRRQQVFNTHQQAQVWAEAIAATHLADMVLPTE